MPLLDSSRLLDSLKSGFISNQIHSDNNTMPTLLVNDYQKDKKILSALIDELETCETFDFSVAFINDSGLAAILGTLSYLRDKNIKGRILTTNYLNFTTPGALLKLMEFPNIEVRAYTASGFHPKGYIFKQSNYYSIIIGSANLTASALSQNQEWSVRFLSLFDGQLVFSVREEFERIWNNATLVTKEWIDNYSIDYNQSKIALKSISPTKEEDLEIVPNSMQQEAMTALSELRNSGKTRALLIAATGTGKTYLSIFDVKQVKPKRVLYVAHRDIILNKSEKSFKNLLPDINTGFLSGTRKDLKANYLFASIFTLAKDSILYSFERDAFDYIIVDEVHHAGATSYKKIIDYFTPKFLLGLTATPERTDGFDIFALFNHNIPYEIRLQKALEEDLLCPFHYYGLTDLTVDGETIDDKSDFSKLISTERIQHIEQAIKLYKSADTAVKGLIFCSRVEEAAALSEALNNDGFHTTFLTGANSDSEREAAIQRLESDTDPLEYIISVDIFNEGVDIPSINQVVMLRPTQSAIIFVQQLGRGLRKTTGKSFVSVIDFIGNYENNFFIPIALYGDNSYNKDNLRRAISTGSAGIPGSSTIQLSEIARKKIFDSISNTSFKQLKILKQEYEKLKIRLARIPTMMDFVNNGFIDPFLFIDHSGSYYQFKCRMEDVEYELSPAAICSLQFISIEFAHGFRPHELILLNMFLTQERVTWKRLKERLYRYGVKPSEKDIDGICNLLSLNFYTQKDRKKYGALTYTYFDKTTNEFVRSKEFSNLLLDNTYFNELKDCLAYGIKRASLAENEIRVDNSLVLYRKYSRKDVCKILNWKSDCSSTVYGYKTETSSEYEYPTCPIFVTYKKSDDISATTKYEDVFIDNTRFNWYSRSRRTSKSDEVSALINQKNNDIKIMLFIKKDDAEGSDFYFLGNMKYNSFEDTTMESENGRVPVVNIQFDMETPVPQNLYNYFERN